MTSLVISATLPVHRRDPLVKPVLSSLCWAEIHLDVVDALVKSMGKKDLATFRLVCSTWRVSVDSCVKHLRPAEFKPTELAATFKAVNRLDLHALDDVTDEQLQELAASQHIPHEDGLLAQALRQLNGGSICGRSECPSVTGSLSRADSFGSIGEAMSEAASSTTTSKQPTPTRRRLGRPPRASSAHHKAASLESIGSFSKMSAKKLRPPLQHVNHTVGSPDEDAAASTSHSIPASTSHPVPPETCADSVLESFHSATSYSTQSCSSVDHGQHSTHSKQRHSHRLRLTEESIGAPQPSGMISAHRPSSMQGKEPESALAWLTSLDISQCWRITDTGVSALAGLTTLEELDMSCCTHVNRMGFMALATLPHLHSLTVAKMNLSPGSLECFGNMTGLRRLSASLCSWDPATEPVANALGKLTRLEELRLANCRSLQDKELAQFLPSLTSLQKLDLAECYKLTEGGMRSIAFPLHLSALDLSRVAVNDTVLQEQMGMLTELKQLSLLGCHQITDRGLQHLLNSMASLKVLDISSCRGISDDGLKQLSSLECLEALVMNNMDAGVTGATLIDLQGLSKLRVLSCAGCAGFTAAAVQAIGRMHSLVEVNLRGWMPNANVNALTALQTLQGVESLQLARWTIGGHAEQAVLASIGHNLGRLVQLDLAESLVSSKGLKELIGLGNLTRLSLKCCSNVNDNALRAVGQIKSLTWLNLHYCKAISDKGLMHLAHLVALSHLDIGFCCKLTDRGIGHLAHLPGLTHVRMAGCPRIKLYQESRETSGKLDIQQWAEYAQTPNERNNRARSWKRLLCICSAPEAE